MIINYIPFSDLLSNVVDNRGKTAPTAAIGIPLIATNCIRNDALYPVYENLRYVSRQTYDAWFRGHPMPGDLIFVTKGTPGRVCMVPDPVDFCIAQDMVAIRANTKIIYPKYLFALLRSQSIQAYIEQLHVGTLIPHFKKGDFNNLLLPIPDDHKIQESIGDIYYYLSLKIELNRRMNRTLEEMAAAIFKSWFVDFDPVVAKSEGRQPFGMIEEIAKLFPSSFDNSQTFPIPKGWEIKKVADICITQYGYTTSASDEQIGPKFLRITDMNKEPWIEWRNVPYCLIHPSIYPKYKLNIGDVLVSRMADPGKAAIIEEEIESVFASYLVRLKTGSLPLSFFLFYFLRSDQYLDYANGAKSGSVQSGMNAKVIVDCDIVLPGPELIDYFYSIIKPLRQKITSNLKEINILSQIRDGLLPQLLSGEIRLSQHKNVTENV